ncbi:hypothetical protein DLJ58_22475 [Micromonospora arida]|uniref:Uncharacterized protein n=1 Tax=Micromonospora arida TaxID=2203715 RepID=A0A3N9X1N9_9ACTN|nr:hypothetical protein DLJ58_22475 [Micromonospora arida]
MECCPEEGARDAGQDTSMATSDLRPVPDRGRDDPGTATPPSVVVAEVELGLPLWSGTALSQPTPHSDQPRALARRGGAVSNEAVHLPGRDRLCTGWRAWWSRLTPYPCWQVDWATNRRTRSLTAALPRGPA